MKNPLEQNQNLEAVVNQLYNIDAKLDAGRIIRAHRENGKLLSFFEKTKQEIITEAKKNNTINSDEKNCLLECMQDIEEVIRQLHKIGSLIYSGQIIAASGCNNRLIAFLRRKYSKHNTEIVDEK